MRVTLQYGDYRIIKPIFILERGALVRVALQCGDYRIIKPIFILKRGALVRVALQCGDYIKPIFILNH